MSETEALFSVLRKSSDPDCAAAIEEAVREASDRDLCRVNPGAIYEIRPVRLYRPGVAFPLTEVSNPYPS